MRIHLTTPQKVAVSGVAIIGIAAALIYWKKPEWLGLQNFKGGANTIQDYTSDTGSLSVYVPHDSSALNDRIFVA